jgi:hypothetical protein
MTRIFISERSKAGWPLYMYCKRDIEQKSDTIISKAYGRNSKVFP